MAIEEVILQNQNLIYSIIKKYAKYFDKEDLFQAGVIGLLKAYKNFNEELGVKFSTYAFSSIFGEVRKFVREDKNIKISREYMKLNQAIEKAKEFLSQRLMRTPSVTELSLFLEMDEEKIADVQAANEFIKSLDYETQEEEIDLYNKIACEEKAYNADIQDLKTELSNLSEEERELIEQRYYNDLTQSETSDKLGISQVQVSRKETKILTKLRQRLVQVD